MKLVRVSASTSHRIAQRVVDAEIAFCARLQRLGHGSHIQCSCNLERANSHAEIEWAMYREGRYPCGRLENGHYYYHVAPDSLLRCSKTATT